MPVIERAVQRLFYIILTGLYMGRFRVLLLFSGASMGLYVRRAKYWAKTSLLCAPSSASDPKKKP